jgi:hypothetical protein
MTAEDLNGCNLEADGMHHYLTIRSVSSLNNPQNNEIKFDENMENHHDLHRLHSEKIHYSCDNIIINNGKFNHLKKNLKYQFFEKKINYLFCQCGN